jgi:aldose 1-epimerase
MNLADMQQSSLTISSSIGVERWGALPGGDTVKLFVLRNAQGMRVSVSDLGATLVSWHAPDRAGRVSDIVLGHDTPADYLAGSAFMGGTIGRCANRIQNACFTLDGLTYSLDRNDGHHSLHGGAAGFHHAVWNANHSDGTLVLTHESPEGDGGYPGALAATVRYALSDDGTLSIDYDAVCNAPTPVNLTNHAYFNLSGESAQEPADVRGHVIGIEADEFFEVDAELIPIRRREVAGNAFDFRTAAPIGARLDWPDIQLARAGGFDHCYVLRGAAGSIRPVATLYDPVSGRELSVWTDAAGMQFYTGNHLSDTAGRHGQRYDKHAGLCLETGAFPNQVNMDPAAGIVLRPGKRYRHTTQYRLGVR